MRKILTTLVIIALVFGAGCKKKKSAEQSKKPVKTAVVQKPVVKDTIKEEEPKPVIEEVEPPKPDNKYFLIAGSFEKLSNAEQFKAKLVGQGFESEVIERPGGPNGEFYKVSYKGFYDRGEAYAELQTARNAEGRDEVWLLVKK